MKQKIFTLVLMLAMVFVASSAWAQTGVGEKFNPYPGSQYTYSLPYDLANGGNVTLTVSGGTITTFTGTSPSGLTNGGTHALASGTGNVTFSILWASTSTGNITFSAVIRDLASGCNNDIEYTFPMAPLPTYTLNIESDIASTCQARTGNANNLPEARGGEANSFTFTVTPAVSGVNGNFTYSYQINLPSNAVLSDFQIASPAALSGNTVTYTNVAAVAVDVFTVSFETTTGEPTQNITATLVEGASTMAPVTGVGTYTATIPAANSNTATVEVFAVPSISPFN